MNCICLVNRGTYRSNVIIVMDSAGSSSGNSAVQSTVKSNTASSMSIIHDVLLNDLASPLRVSVFTNNVEKLRHSLRMHGISSDSYSLNDCRTLLVRHLFTGSCVTLKDKTNCHASGARRDLTACRYFATDFATAREMSAVVVETTVSAKEYSMPKEYLVKITRCLCLPVEALSCKRTVRTQCIDALIRWRQNSASDDAVHSHHISASDTIRNMEKYSKLEVQALAIQHGLEISPRAKADAIREIVREHLVMGKCISQDGQSARVGCKSAIDNLEHVDNYDDDGSRLDLQIRLLSSVVSTIQLKPLRKLLTLHGVPFEPSFSLRMLRSRLRRHIKMLIKGKQVSVKQAVEDGKANIRDKWPSLVPNDLKSKIVHNFRERTSKEALSSFTCASCAEKCLNRDSRSLELDEIDPNLLARPDRRVYRNNIVDPMWLDLDCVAPEIPIVNGESSLLLDAAGLITDDGGKTRLLLCITCFNDLRQNRTPALSIANHNFIGGIPEQLKDLTVVEEAMIARCRAKCWIVQLKEEDRELSMPDTQRGMKGHVIIYPQRPSELANVLPCALNDYTTFMCVIFVGSKPPTDEWLQTKAKPLVVRREKVRNALVWLKGHNPLYKNVRINHEMLNELAPTQVLPVQIDHVQSNGDPDPLTSRYDNLEHEAPPVDEDNCCPLQSVVITDIDGSAPPNELRAAAWRHVKKKGNAYVEVPHDPEPVNEFCHPELFPMIYPTLFPYGLGGVEDSKRCSRLGMKRHVKHLFSLADSRFQEHYSFLFTAFNILQRRAVLLHTSLKVKRRDFPQIASGFATISQEAVHKVTERVARGDTTTADNDDEAKVLKLMRQVKMVTSHVPGSSASRIAMRNEMRGLMMSKGLPSFYLTINPADVFNPLVKFLAGSDIDIDHLFPDQVPDYREQAFLIARNPAVAAKFFNIYMRAFIDSVLGYDPKQNNLEGGVLGVVKAYYGCVESQGRGTLHCHMLVWLEGGLNPNQIKDKVLKDGESEFCTRLLAFLDDTISTEIPKDPDPSLVVPSSLHHPCSVRGIDSVQGIDPGRSADGSSDPIIVRDAQQKDLHNLARKCQAHRHTDTCYQYWKGYPYPLECRFDLHESNYNETSTIDPETGELELRCLDGLVNNFNSTMLEAIRCNMDIQFIGSGPTAKAILYYITNYISKEQLKTHVAFAALELSVKKLDEYCDSDDEQTIRAKRLLQKCAHAMISHQELSAQMVCSYLLDLGDHYTSHKYGNLYWHSFEGFIERQSQETQREPVDFDTGPMLIDEDGDEAGDEDIDMSSDSSYNDDDNLGSEFEDNDSNHSDDSDNGLLKQNDTEEDVRISTDQSGELVAKAGQVMDYQLRGEALDEICVWDFISRIQKVRSGRDNHQQHAQSAVSDGVDSYESDSDDDSDMECQQRASRRVNPLTKWREASITEILEHNGRYKPYIELLEKHPESKTHILSVREAGSALIPVPIGQSMPRRDRPDVQERYSRLMLILFKPWRTASDLRKDDKLTWQEAFSDYSAGCPDYIREIMDNMQILHECRDSRDDHFTGRRIRPKNRCNRVPQNMDNHEYDDDGIYAEEEDERSIVLRHIEEVERIRLIQELRQSEAVRQCLDSAERAGLYKQRPDCIDRVMDDDSLIEIVNNGEGCHMEDVWRRTYEARRSESKKKNIHASLSRNTDDNVPAASTSVNVRDTSGFIASLQPSDVRLPGIRQEINASEPDYHVDIPELIEEFTLNSEQARAFRLVCEHSHQIRPEPLRMLLGGAGGTGKSRVIDALTEFFRRRNQGRRFRLSSYTGVAARNISGMTLHSALNLDRPGRKSVKAHHDLVAMWEGVDYLFIDEVSMIGCRLLFQISEALVSVKGNTSAFGGINIIFAGDFAQLPPVGQKKLFSQANTNRKATVRGQENLFGKLLWLSVKTVIILTKVMRQAGVHNEEFVNLLARLREGKCTHEDFNALNSRVIENAKPDLTEPTWTNAPVIVYDNKVKDALNRKAAEAFALRTGQQLHWYHATDRWSGKDVLDDALINALGRLHSGRTKQRLGQIPLVLGMPVIISQNFDVEAGVVNGCIGTLKKIRYRLDSLGRRHAISCVVHAPNTDGECLPNLPKQYVVALEDTQDIELRHPFSLKNVKIKRTQVPIVPAFAMTAYKAQGQTLSNAIVDLASCSGTESPYVMISRVKSLDGLLILRPFSENKITCRRSEDARREMKRLEFLHLRTMIEHSSADEELDVRERARVAGFGTSQMEQTIHYREENPMADRNVVGNIERLQSQWVRIDNQASRNTSKRRSGDRSDSARARKRTRHR